MEYKSVQIPVQIRVYPGNGYWVAEGCGVDYLTEGTTSDEAIEHFIRGLSATFEERWRVSQESSRRIPMIVAVQHLFVTDRGDAIYAIAPTAEEARELINRSDYAPIDTQTRLRQIPDDEPFTMYFDNIPPNDFVPDCAHGVDADGECLIDCGKSPYEVTMRAGEFAKKAQAASIVIFGEWDNHRRMTI